MGKNEYKWLARQREQQERRIQRGIEKKEKSVKSPIYFYDINTKLYHTSEGSTLVWDCENNQYITLEQYRKREMEREMEREMKQKLEKYYNDSCIQ